MPDNPNPRHPFPAQIGHLVFIEEITPDEGRYRCTHKGCARLVKRQRTSALKSWNAKSESSCNPCQKVIRKRKTAAFNAGLSRRNQNV